MKKMISLMMVAVMAFSFGYALKVTKSRVNTYTETCTYYTNNPECPQLGGSFYGSEIWDINNPTLEDGKIYVVELSNHETPNDATDDIVIGWTLQE